MRSIPHANTAPYNCVVEAAGGRPTFLRSKAKFWKMLPTKQIVFEFETLKSYKKQQLFRVRKMQQVMKSGGKTARWDDRMRFYR